MDLLTEIIKAQDNAQEIKFTFNGHEFKFYFKYLTLLEKVRIDQMSTKMVTETALDGSITRTMERQEHLIPIHTIIEKALDEDGKRLFSHLDEKGFKTISQLPAATASLIAYEMSRDIFGTMKPKEKEEDK